eukprot:5152818-Prymnesium_polylepis.1
MKIAVMGFCWCDLTVFMKVLAAFARPDMPLTFLEIYLGPAEYSLDPRSRNKSKGPESNEEFRLSFLQLRPSPSFEGAD